MRGDGPEDDEFRQNMQRSLAAQLQQVSKQCREQQKVGAGLSCPFPCHFEGF